MLTTSNNLSLVASAINDAANSHTTFAANSQVKTGVKKPHYVESILPQQPHDYHTAKNYPALTMQQAEIIAGLTAPKKKISSKFFYDANGDAIFSSITTLPEYYLTASEQEILLNNAVRIAVDANMPTGAPFIIAELGAGDGTKTIPLMQALIEAGYAPQYAAIDISAAGLKKLEAKFNANLPNTKFTSIAAEYSQGIAKLKRQNLPVLYLWLGSSIGNFNCEEAATYLQLLSSQMESHDAVLVGFDLVKNPQIILNAYNDTKGVTAAFNHNVLKRLNNELGANFNTDKFLHYPVYDTHLNQARSYLISTEKQAVIMGKAGVTITFDAWEAIHTEVSQKYQRKDIDAIVASAKLKISETYLDRKRYFADVLLVKE